MYGDSDSVWEEICEGAVAWCVDGLEWLGLIVC